MNALLIGQIMAITFYAFDGLAVTTIMPLISAELGGAELYGWVFSAFFLASLTGSVWAGALNDRYGPGKPFVWGLGLFIFGLFIACICNTMFQFVIARGLQGLGAGGVSAALYASINIAYPAEIRPRILSYMSAAWAIPGLLAPLAAGLIADYLSWRYLFVFLILLALIAGALSMRGMNSLAPEENKSPLNQRNMALALTVALGAGLLLYGLDGRPDPLRITLIILGGLGLVYSIEGIFPGVFRLSSDLRLVIALKFILSFAFFGAETFLPLILHKFYHVGSASEAGVVLTAAALSWSGTTFLQARLAKILTTRRLLLLGTLQVLAGITLLLVMMRLGWPYYLAYVFWAFAGSGMGMAINTIIASSMRGTPEGKEGLTSTANGISDALSFGLATGVGGAILNAGKRADLPPGELYSLLWGMMILVAVFGLLLGLWRLSRTERLTIEG